MACAKPQVLTNILGMSSIVEEVGGGYVVQQKNSRALADAILRISKSKSTRLKMGKNNRKAVVKNLSTKGIGKLYVNIFNKVI
jgi:glycosyltransferase involved in cell wall biosynthesis